MYFMLTYKDHLTKEMDVNFNRNITLLFYLRYKEYFALLLVNDIKCNLVSSIKTSMILLPFIGFESD